MAKMNFSVPDDVKSMFNKVFDRQNKSAVVTDLMREAIEREVRRQVQLKAVENLLWSNYEMTPEMRDVLLPGPEKVRR